jgi:hypothetical protein
MKQKIDFNHWLSMYQIMKKFATTAKIKNRSLTEVYEELIAFFDAKGDGVSILGVLAEMDWYKYGQPYYKLWPSMAESLANINIDIDCKYFHMPFPCFEVRFPKEPVIREHKDAPPVRAMLVYRAVPEEIERLGFKPETEGYDREWTLCTHYQFETDVMNDYMGWYFNMGILSGQTLNHRLTEAAKNSVYFEKGYQPREEFQLQLMRISIGVAFFGMHQHDMILPDIPTRYEERWHRARANKDKKEQDHLLERAKKMQHYGWLVGSEIDLPQPVVRHLNEANEGTGRELTFGHVRSGHMRLQPYGPKDNPNEYKLIFVCPTLVRPDLPLAATRGFRIGAIDD